jgi:hypothetical protein
MKYTIETHLGSGKASFSLTFVKSKKGIEKYKKVKELLRRNKLYRH